MGPLAVYQKLKTSQPHPGHRIHPYLLCGLAGKKSDPWCVDTTYVRQRCGLRCLVAIMDWCSQSVLSWYLSNILDADFCVAVLEEAITHHALLKICNTDQEAQSARLEFSQALKDAGVAISIDGKRRWMDTIFIARRWSSVRGGRELETLVRPATRSGTGSGFTTNSGRIGLLTIAGRDVHRHGHSASNAV